MEFTLVRQTGSPKFQLTNLGVGMCNVHSQHVIILFLFIYLFFAKVPYLKTRRLKRNAHATFDGNFESFSSGVDLSYSVGELRARTQLKLTRLKPITSFLPARPALARKGQGRGELSARTKRGSAEERKKKAYFPFPSRSRPSRSRPVPLPPSSTCHAG